jgi:sec-independent protein translocase protein TatB
MFDVSFSELMLIGIVALVVIGPQRLPTVARTIGHLVGRAQRYVNDVKSDIQREMDLDELRNLKGQMEDAARTVQASMTETAQELQQAKDSLADAAHSMQSELQSELQAPLQAPLKNAEEKIAQATASIGVAAAATDKAVETAEAAAAAIEPPADAEPAVPDAQKTLPGFAEASALAEAEQPAPIKPPSSTPSGTPT